jgi:hypothetical protein
LIDGEDYDLGTPGTATVTITDDEAATIEATDPDAAELGGNNATFELRRGVGEPTTSDRDVFVTVSGTAVFSAAAGSGDYGITSPAIVSIDSLSGNFTARIPAGQTSVTVTVTPTSDALVEGSETVIFTAEGTAASATITDGG